MPKGWYHNKEKFTVEVLLTLFMEVSDAGMTDKVDQFMEEKLPFLDAKAMGELIGRMAAGVPDEHMLLDENANKVTLSSEALITILCGMAYAGVMGERMNRGDVRIGA